MIVDIDIKQLGSLATEMNSLIDEVEEAELNIFNQLKDATVNWQDGNSVVFEEQIRNEKKETRNFLVALQNNRKLYQTVYDEYKSIGNKLHINMEKKDAIINAIDDAIAKIDSALYEFDRVERSFYYYELGLINNERANLAGARKQLKELRNKVNDIYKKVKSSEERIASKIAKLEEIKVSRFSFNIN